MSRSFRLELAIAIVAACLLVLGRNWVFLVYEHSFFDSDQAIVGLMAKHIIEGRAFPLFQYGQPYLLAIDGWFAVPFIAIGGLTVAALRMSAITMSWIIVTLLVVTLVRQCRIRPLYALAAVVFFAFAPPVTNASLIEPGANTSPFLFMLLLWFLRERPIAFGAVLAVAFLNREFTIYVLPPILVLQLLSGGLFTKRRLRHWALAAGAAAVVYTGILALRPLADSMGPGTRGVPTWAEGQVGNLMGRVAVLPAELPRRAWAMITVHFPRMLGGRHADENFASQGRDWLFWPLTLAMAVGLGRVAWLMVRRRSAKPAHSPEQTAAPRWHFAAYLLGVGLTALAGYVATRPAEISNERYYLYGLLVPIGIMAWLFVLEPHRRWRVTAAALAAAWTLSSGADYLDLARRYWGGRTPNELRVLADALVARHITVAKAGYWRAYKITFLTGERVKVASSDFIRIAEYQRLADQAGPSLIVIQEKPCPGGEHISAWYLCRPGVRQQ